jgi:hypothetical protein
MEPMNSWVVALGCWYNEVYAGMMALVATVEMRGERKVGGTEMMTVGAFPVPFAPARWPLIDLCILFHHACHLQA